MDPLDPELHSLVAAERGEVEPSTADRERIGRSLLPRVGAGFGLGLSLVASPATGAAAASGAGLLLKVASVVALASAVAVVAVPRLSNSGAPAPKASPAAAMAPAQPAAPTPSPSAAVEPEPLPPTPSDAPAARTPSPSAAPSLPPLAEEARLLKQAQQALRDGQAGAALAALTEHQRRFPRGQLALERSAARIQALCGLGQKQQAEREGKAFLKQHPSSGLSAQVRASCGFSAPTR